MDSVTCAPKICGRTLSPTPARPQRLQKERLSPGFIAQHFSLALARAPSPAIWKLCFFHCPMQLQDPPLSQRFDYIPGSLNYQLQAPPPFQKLLLFRPAHTHGLEVGSCDLGQVFCSETQVRKFSSNSSLLQMFFLGCELLGAFATPNPPGGHPFLQQKCVEHVLCGVRRVFLSA